MGVNDNEGSSLSIGCGNTDFFVVLVVVVLVEIVIIGNEKDNTP